MNEVVNNLRNFAKTMDKAIAESKSALAQHEYDLNRAKSQYAYNFAYKSYEETFEQVKLLETKLYLLKGIAKMSAARLFKKIKKDVNEHLAVPKIPFKEVV